MTKSRGILPPRRWWHDDELAWLIALYPDVKTDLVAEALGRTVKQCYQKARQLGLGKSAEYLASPEACRLRRGEHVGAAYWFGKGHTPWNKGSHFTAGGRSAETRFKPGTRNGRAAKLWQPIGSTRLSKEGYLQRKVSDTGYTPRDYVGVHTLLWQEHHGPVPPGHALCFKNGDKTDIRLDNLELVTRAELMRRNSYHTNYPPEIRRVIQLRGALNRKINARSKTE